MTLDDLLRLSQIRDRLDGLPVTEAPRTLEGFCYLATAHLQEALHAQRRGEPARYTGREGARKLEGYMDPSFEEREAYVPDAADPIGYGSYVVESLVVLLALCRAHRIPVKELLERRLQKYESKGRKKR